MELYSTLAIIYKLLDESNSTLFLVTFINYISKILFVIPWMKMSHYLKINRWLHFCSLIKFYGILLDIKI